MPSFDRVDATLNTYFHAFDNRVKNSTRLIELSRFKKFSTGDIIIHEADTNDIVYFILEGRVKVTNFSEKGREVWHNELVGGQTFGEVAALTGQKRVASVIAIHATKVALITRDEFFALIHHDASVAIWVMEELASRLKVASQKFYELVSYSVPLRVRSEIIKLCEGNETGDNEIEITPIPNFSELARRINTDRENVSREISYLSKNGILKKTKTSLVILDISYLKSNLLP